jgi:hypothetical protein
MDPFCLDASEESSSDPTIPEEQCLFEILGGFLIAELERPSGRLLPSTLEAEQGRGRLSWGGGRQA